MAFPPSRQSLRITGRKQLGYHLSVLAIGLLGGSLVNPAVADGRREPVSARSEQSAPYPIAPPQARAAKRGGSVLQRKIREIAAAAEGRVGVSCSLPGQPLDCDLNPDETPPMQSVFKLPLALSVLHQVEQGSLSLDQLVRFGPDDRILPRTHSPLQERYPEASVDVPIRELLRLTVSLSDNAAADLLLRAIGGPDVVNDYIGSLGVAGFHLEDNEHALHRDVGAQYRNWFTPAGAVQLLRRISDNSPISATNTEQLLTWLSDSVKPARLKGDLPAGTPVAHKAGSSGVDAGIAHATNDIGLITLPGGKTLAIAVFITDSRADEHTREAVISGIARAVYDAGVQASERSADETAPRTAAMADFAREELSRRNASGFIHVRDIDSREVLVHVSRSAQGHADPALSIDAPMRPLSVIKVYLAASWLEHGFGDTVLDCPSRNRMLRGPLVGEIFSSGCDAAGMEMALILKHRLGGAEVLSDLHRYGLRDLTLRADAPDEDWGSTLSLGEENVRVTPGEVSAFFATIGQSDGHLLSGRTAETLRKALEGVVQHGTASAINDALSSPDWHLGGKTGTGPGRCGQSCDGWFASILSWRDRPRYVILVFVRSRGPGGGVATHTAAAMANYVIAEQR